MIKKITIPYFPIGMKYATPVFIAAGVYLIINGIPIWGVLFLVTSALILTTNYITEIDLHGKIYKDYLSLLGLPFNNESNTFNTIDRIIITKRNYSQTINTRAQSRQMDWTDYTATLIMDNDNTLDLLTKNDKHKLLLNLKEFSTFLNVGVEDRTTHKPYFIDMDKV